MGRSTTLWHYTDANGFYGIVQSGNLRLGDARFLNDRTEREYGIGIVMRVIAEELQASEKQHDFLTLTTHYLQRSEAYTIHVCSFSEVSNSISQWQRYGADGYGYCLGFTRSALRRLKTSDLRLRRVIYNQKKQLEMVRTSVRTFRDAFRIASDERDTSLPRDILLGTSAALSAHVLEGLALELKDASFKDEREWRLIHRVLTRSEPKPTAPNVQFGPRGNLVKPFIEVALTRGKTRTAPIAAVVCGPRSDGGLSAATASYFLKATGHSVTASWSELHKVWR